MVVIECVSKGMGGKGERGRGGIWNEVFIGGRKGCRKGSSGEGSEGGSKYKINGGGRKHVELERGELRSRRG